MFVWIGNNPLNLYLLTHKINAFIYIFFKATGIGSFARHKQRPNNGPAVIDQGGREAMDCLMESCEATGEEPAPEVAMAIKRCLESLVKDARRGQMDDLAEFLALAVLAADDAARAARKAGLAARPAGLGDLVHRKVAGSC